MIDYRLKPREKEPMHSHPHGVFVYFLSEAKTRTTFPDGKISEDTKRAGEKVWRDLDKSAEFYRTVLGLEQVPDPFKDGRHVFIRLSPHSELHLIAGGQTDMKRIDVHFALRVASLPTVITFLQEKHVKYFSAKREEGVVTHRPDGVNQVYLQDPDGYWVELNDSRL